MGSTLRTKNLLLGEQILFFKSLTLMRWEAKENKRVASPESVPIHLKELTPFENGGNKTCHRDRIVRLTAPCPSYKEL